MEERYDHILTEQENAASGLRDIFIILFKYKYSIITVFFLILATVTAVTFLLTPIYEAKSSLLVKFGREYIYRSEVGDSRPTVFFQSFNHEEAIRSEIEILTSKSLIKKVINAIGVGTLYSDLAKSPPWGMNAFQAAMIELEKDISVKNVKKSNVIEVSIENENPEIAAMAVNLLVELFKEKHLQVFSSPKSSFLEKQLKAYELKLTDSENDLEMFKQKYSIYSLGEQRSLLLKQRMDLDVSLKRDQNRIRELEQMLSSPHSELIMVSKEINFYMEAERFKLVNEAKVRLLAIQLKEQELLGKYREGNRLVVNIRKEIKLVKEFIEEQEKKFAEAELGSLKARGDLIKEQIRQQDDEIMNIDMKEKELHILKRNMATNERNYEVYQNKYEEALISEDMDRQKIANISVIQEAVVPAKPVKPRKVLNIVLGIILADLVALGFAFMAEYFSQVLSTPERAEKRLKIPVLTTISYRS